MSAIKMSYTSVGFNQLTVMHPKQKPSQLVSIGAYGIQRVKQGLASFFPNRLNPNFHCRRAYCECLRGEYRGQHLVMVLKNMPLHYKNEHLGSICLLFWWSLGQLASCIIMADILGHLLWSRHIKMNCNDCINVNLMFVKILFVFIWCWEFGHL